MAESKIEWTDRSDWNPIRGCTRVSPGCGGPGPHGGCYAEAIAARFSGEGQAFHSFAERTSKGPRWTGKVEVQWDRLSLPLRWRSAAKIFASSTSDFFHEALPMAEIAQLFGVMIAAHHVRGHTFQVLTKRADLMRKTLTCDAFWEIANAEASMHVLNWTDPLNRRSDDARATLGEYGPAGAPPGIWLGVSVEDQQRADERIPHLLATPAAVRFLSCEPLLGSVDLGSLPMPTGMDVCDCEDHRPTFDALHGSVYCAGCCEGPERFDTQIDWVIAGGESGQRARPMHPDWARSLRDQCAEAGVPFLFKQWGEWVPQVGAVDGWNLGDNPEISKFDYRDWLGDRWSEPYGVDWTVEVDADTVSRIGKKRAGRLLDGIEHNGFPEVQHG